MNAKESKDFAKEMKRLGTAFNQPVTEDHITIYFEALADYSISEIRKGVSKFLSTSKWFPKIADFHDVLADSHRQTKLREMHQDRQQAKLLWEDLLEKHRQMDLRSPQDVEIMPCGNPRAGLDSDMAPETVYCSVIYHHIRKTTEIRGRFVGYCPNYWGRPMQHVGD